MVERADYQIIYLAQVYPGGYSYRSIVTVFVTSFFHFWPADIQASSKTRNKTSKKIGKGRIGGSVRTRRVGVGGELRGSPPVPHRNPTGSTQEFHRSPPPWGRLGDTCANWAVRGCWEMAAKAASAWVILKTQAVQTRGGHPSYHAFDAMPRRTIILGDQPA
jgi:hypothetical protein